jgi:hypothetical protein
VSYYSPISKLSKYNHITNKERGQGRGKKGEKEGKRERFAEFDFGNDEAPR